MNEQVVIIGGGLAGCEAAWQVAKRKIRCILYEMRPENMTPAHRTDMLGELVCSSSLKSNSPETAHGLLKQEMRKFGSIIIDCAEKNSVPGGDALCVDRIRFAQYLTEKINNNPYIELIREEITEIPDDRPCVIATGPLTSDAFTNSIIKLTNAENLHFFDAIAPSVDVESIDMEKVFRQSRYDKGEAAYLNCPMTKDEYYAFIEALVSAEIANLHLQEEKDNQYYEGCLPVEVMASRGIETLAHGMMKPVGLTDPKTGRWPYAVLQLRQENNEGSVYGLVGFQTQLKQSEQERVFRMIPGLENAKFVRFGAVHRNTYINSPDIITASLNSKSDNGLFFAGQITGVEGYMESAASGIIAGINAARFVLNQSPIILPKATMIGSLMGYISTSDSKTFQPMNSNFGILPPLEIKHKKHMRKELKIKAAVEAMDEFIKDLS